MELVRLVLTQARLNPSEPAVIFGGGVVDFRGLAGAVSAVTEVLATLNVPRGAYVLLDVQNPLHHLALFYALALCGIRSASVGTLHGPSQTGPRPDLFLTDRSDIDPQGLATRRVDARWFAHEATQAVDYPRLMALPGFDRPDDIVRYVYSSGTTGRPKCVALSVETLERRIHNVALLMPMQMRSGRLLNMMGFSTILGTMMPFMAQAQAGALCFAGGSTEALQLMRLFDISDLYGSVTQVAALLDALGTDLPPPGLKLVAPAGARLSDALLTSIRARLCANIRSGYGSTEMGAVAAMTGPMMARRPGSVGYVLPWAEVEIVDEAGTRLAPGHDGLIRMKSRERADYADDTGALAPSVAEDGWFYPGDIGQVSADGELSITGRSGDVINRGGIVVAPEEIEDALRSDPRVRDAGVVAVPNAAGIDEIWAAIISKEPIEAAGLQTALRARLNDRVPDRVFALDSIPRTETGKVMRFRLREMLLELTRAP